MIDVGTLNDYSANIGKSLAVGSNCSYLEEMVKPKFLDKTIFLYPTDANQVHSLIRNCKTTNSSGLDGLSNNLLNFAGPVISDFLAVIILRCIQVGFFPSILQNARIKPLFKTGDMQNLKIYRPI